jgi:basic membrane lipoprotein Med (substrate-binding protein (PBP1-ABC) superfamily)
METRVINPSSVLFRFSLPWDIPDGRRDMRNRFLFLTAIVITVLAASCGDRDENATQSIAVFVPGVLEGSPTYEMMDQGVRASAEKAEIEVKTVEGGFDQASWENQLMVLASEGRYGLIVTSNPAMSEIAVKAAESYPDQEFLVLDGSGLTGNGVSDLVYDHREQAFLIGYFAALVTESEDLEGANEQLKVGMIIGQEYPQMNREILPGYEIGMHTVNPDIEMEVRILGNWYDAEKARELASGLYQDGVDVILTIAGGANQGVIAAAKENGTYVLWFDSDGTGFAPGTVLASAVIHQDRAAAEAVERWINGDMEMGQSNRLGIVEGYVDFPMDGKDFRKHVPESIADQMAEVLERMKSGNLSLRTLDG